MNEQCALPPSDQIEWTTPCDSTFNFKIRTQSKLQISCSMRHETDIETAITKVIVNCQLSPFT